MIEVSNSQFLYGTKPVTVEAVAFSVAEGDETKAIPQWFVQAILKGTLYQRSEGRWGCITRNGPVLINPTDMIIRLADGEIYPCALEVFNAKYELVQRS